VLSSRRPHEHILLSLLLAPAMLLPLAREARDYTDNAIPYYAWTKTKAGKVQHIPLSAIRMRPRSRWGMPSSSFSADRATCSVQGMEEFIQVYELATGVLAACAPQRPDILHRGRDSGEAGCDVCPESLADQLRPRAVLGLADPLHLFDHFRRKRDGHSLSRSHVEFFLCHLV